MFWSKFGEYIVYLTWGLKLEFQVSKYLPGLGPATRAAADAKLLPPGLPGRSKETNGIEICVSAMTQRFDCSHIFNSSTIVKPEGITPDFPDGLLN
jgi:hypothetical protein